MSPRVEGFDYGKQPARSPMSRGRRIRQVSPKRQAEKASRVDVRLALEQRDRGVCLLDDRQHAHLLAGRCVGVWTPHHLLKASAGGAYVLENLVTLCAGHNTWVEDNPPRAKELGLVVVRGLIPPDEAARRRAEFRLAR